eukprot:6213705-Pleurochrysis_carterae.AAC.1
MRQIVARSRKAARGCAHEHPSVNSSFCVGDPVDENVRVLGRHLERLVHRLGEGGKGYDANADAGAGAGADADADADAVVVAGADVDCR